MSKRWAGTGTGTSMENLAGSDPELKRKIDEARREYYGDFLSKERWAAQGFAAPMDAGNHVIVDPLGMDEQGIEEYDPEWEAE